MQVGWKWRRLQEGNMRMNDSATIEVNYNKLYNFFGRLTTLVPTE